MRDGQQRRGEQRYRWHNTDGPRPIFLFHSRHHGRLPMVKQPKVDRALHGSGIRETARVLGGSPPPSSTRLKKESALQHVNEGLLQRLDPQQAEVIVHQGEAAAGEAMGSFVGSPSQPRGGVACDRALHGTGLRLGLWGTKGSRLLGTHRRITALGYHALFPRGVGGLSSSLRA